MQNPQDKTPEEQTPAADLKQALHDLENNASHIRIQIDRLRYEMGQKKRTLANTEATIDILKKEIYGQHIETLKSLLADDKMRDSFTVLIDGSGSNASQLPATLQAVAAIQQKLPKKTVSTAHFYGDSRMQTIADPNARINMRGLLSQSDLAPSLKDFFNATAKTDAAKHLVIFTDGDLTDRKEAAEVLADLLKQDKVQTVDFIQQGKFYGNQANELVQSLSAVFADRVKMHQVDTAQTTAEATLKKIVKTRRKEAAPAKKSK